MNDDVQLVREIGEVKAELSGLKAEVAGTNQRLDDIVITRRGAVRPCWRGCCGRQPRRAHHEVLHAVDFSELSKWI